MPKAPQSRSGRYAEYNAAQLADAVERSYERDELPDWELIFELSRRCLSGEADEARPGTRRGLTPGVGVTSTGVV